MTAIRRWLPAITNAFDAKNPVVRKAGLGIAGLAFVGGALAGPATIAQAATEATLAATPVASVQADQPTKQHKSANQVGFQYQEQPNSYYCGPASTRIALTAQGHPLSQADLAKKLGTTTNGTNSVAEIARVLNNVTGNHAYKTTSIPGETATTAQTDKFRADAVNAIDDGRVVVTNVIGTATNQDGRLLSFPGGHYITVVGYADNGHKMKIADPWQPIGDGTYWMPTDDLANWMATRGYTA